MFPLKDTIPSKSFPIVTWLLILANLGCFIFELLLNEKEIHLFISLYGLTPAKISLPSISDLSNFNYKQYYPFLSNMFLHGGWGHLLGNMWMLFIFGDNVEDRMGKVKFLLFYILAGILAGISHILLNPGSEIPAIGASGAISGVMGAYMFLFPKSRIISFVPIFILPLLIPIPAFIFLGIWFIGQLYSGTATLMLDNDATGIAFWAHIGGFIAGTLIYRIFVKRQEIRTKQGNIWF